MRGSEPVNRDQMLDLAEFRVPGDDHGVFSQSSCHSEDIGVGHRVVSFDLRRLKGKLLIAWIELDWKGFELPDDLLGHQMISWANG